MAEIKSVQMPVELHQRIARLRKIAKQKMNLEDGLFVGMSGIIAMAITLLEKEWEIDE